MTSRQPWRLGPGRRLTLAGPLEHLDDLVKAVLLTGPQERLHQPGFGAGLGASVLFEPLSGELGSTVAARIQGSLADALGDRIQLVGVDVSVSESTIAAEVTYRPLPAGASRTVAFTLPGAGS
ncbi:hypothetical protein ACPPVO_36390 [Dactylosporangium sp. McL0621]|uniref:hypothetical protein n=1 Tax=Dactylosporangium sp. McL0621 TaxID=3415678 RepID=UPI003CE805C9